MSSGSPIGGGRMDPVSQTRFTTPIIGRDVELARLSGALERARRGEARTLLVAGDAGVGKTRVLDEMAVRAAQDGMIVLTGHCVDLGDVGLPYLPFTEVLGALADDERFADVGEELYITGKTASVHVSNILAELGAASRTEAVAIAYREGLVTREETVG